MMGRTHVVNSLALVHIGLVGYRVYLDDGGVVGQELFESAGLPLTEPLSVAQYAFISMISFTFALLLLRIGKRGLRTSYLSVIAFSLAGLWVFSETVDPLILAGVVLAYMLGSLLPDIDSETSSIGRYVKPIARVIPHRTITHTAWFVLVFVGLSWYTGSIYLWALSLGVFTHIVQDSFSKQGIAWFYPIIGGYEQFGGGGVVKRGRKSVFTYTVDGAFELYLFYASIAVNVLLVGYVVFIYFA